MDLLVIRHAIAGDRDEWAATGRPDHERPVTAEGRRRMRDNARALATLVPDLGVIATSPFVRAVETAEVVREAFGKVKVIEAPVLAHGSHPETVCAWLAQRTEPTVALVGHEPDLGMLVSWFLTGSPEPVLGLKKGGACLLRFDEAPGPGEGELRWMLPPRVLRQVHAP